MAKDLGLLFFGPPNAKLQRLPVAVATFSLPAGYTCPGAHGCLAKFDRVKRKLIDGKHQRFRCFAASAEARYPSVRASVDRNWALLRAAGTTERMADVIHKSLPAAYFTHIRIHVDGDYYSEAYLLAWINVAKRNPGRTFYGYTKSLQYWVKFKALIPPNMVLNASWDGKFDSLIEEHNLPNARVYFTPEEAEADGVEIDHDDSHAMDPGVHRFGLLVHDTGPAGSAHNAAVKELKRRNIQFSYGRAR